MRALLRGAGLAAFFLAASCATLPPPPNSELLGLLSPDALLYVEAEGPALGTLAERLGKDLPAGDTQDAKLLGQLRSLAARSRGLGLALLALEGRGETGHPLPPFEAAISGKFGAFALGLQLSTSPGWKRSEGGWKNEALDLALALPRPGLLLAARGEPRSLVSPERHPGTSPLPPRYAAPGASKILVWAPDPLGRLGPALGVPAELDSGELGLSGALLELELGAEGLPAQIRFLFAGEARAKTAMPALRLAWLFLSQRLPLGEQPPVFTREGEELVVSGIALDPAKFRSLILSRGPRG